MSDARTPGQIAYETVHCACGCWHRDLEDEDRQRWEAAAQAVLEAAQHRRACAAGLCRRGPPLATTRPATPDDASFSAAHTGRGPRGIPPPWSRPSH